MAQPSVSHHRPDPDPACTHDVRGHHGRQVSTDERLRGEGDVTDRDVLDAPELRTVALELGQAHGTGAQTVVAADQKVA